MLNPRILLFALVLLFQALPAAAQPYVLPDDPSVTTGTLGNGLKYYVVKDLSMRGTADIMLLKRSGRLDEDSLTAGFSDLAGAMAFVRTRCFPEGRLASFLAGTGMTLWTDAGYRAGEDFTALYFRNVPVRDRQTKDSVMLFLLDAARGCSYSQHEADSTAAALGDLQAMRTGGRSAFPGVRTPVDTAALENFMMKTAPMSQQALAVVGDVDTDEIVRTLGLLFMTEPPREFRGENLFGVFVPTDSATVVTTESSSVPFCRMSVSYMAKALPLGLRNSVVPVISSQMKEYTGMLLRRRLERLAGAGLIDIYGCETAGRDLYASRDAEVFTIVLDAPQDRAQAVASALGAELRDVDENGFSQQEYEFAKNMFYSGAAAIRSGEDSRCEWTRRVVRNYLENGPLASGASEREYLRSHQVKDSLGLFYLNRFASTMIDTAANMRLSAVVPCGGVSADDLYASFLEGWRNGDSLASAVRASDRFAADSVLLPVTVRKIKALVTRTEPITKAHVMNFSNGAKVYYRECPQEDFVRFSFSYRGGFGADPDYRNGEGAFYADLMKVDSVAGMPYAAFSKLLESLGIEVEYDFDVRSFSISGTAPADMAHMVWRAVDAIVNARRPDTAAFARYSAAWKVLLSGNRTAGEFRRDTLDAIVHPQQKYTDVRRLQALETLDYLRISRFISDRVSKGNEPVIAFSGPMSVDEFKEVCQTESGWVNRKRHRQRIDMGEEYVCTGKITSRAAFPMERPYKAMDVLYTVPLSYTAENIYLAEVASRVVQARINAALVPFGTASSVDSYFRSMPKERCYVHVTVPFPEHMVQLTAVPVVKTAFSTASSSDARALEMAKAALLDEMKTVSGRSDFWISVINRRYIYNKDFYSDYERKIGEITIEDVEDFVRKMEAGGCVELLVRGKDSCSEDVM